MSKSPAELQTAQILAQVGGSFDPSMLLPDDLLAGRTEDEPNEIANGL
jgi:hypothetical protein